MQNWLFVPTCVHCNDAELGKREGIFISGRSFGSAGFSFLFCPEPLLKRLPPRTARRGHSLPHLSSQCQEQSKQNKLRGEGGNKVQGAPLWMFNYLFRLLTEDLFCTALMFTQKTKLKLQLKFPVSCSHCAEREARLGTRLFVLRSPQGV